VSEAMAKVQQHLQVRRDISTQHDNDTADCGEGRKEWNAIRLSTSVRLIVHLPSAPSQQYIYRLCRLRCLTPLAYMMLVIRLTRRAADGC
jgi:hypothetical protein